MDSESFDSDLAVDQMSSLEATAIRPIVVGIGASAGGVEALERLFEEVPSDSGMAFVVIQHIAPNYNSLMHEIIARRTSMPVMQIKQGVEVKPNHVYVLPSGLQATTDGDRLIVMDQLGQRPHNPIDAFLHSLAQHHNKFAAGVILSGTGSDGAEGIRAVHRNGGLVLVQSESSSKFNGMPRAAIHTGVADAILPVDEIPAALVRFSEAAFAPGNKSGKVLFSEATNAEDRIHQLLHCKYGVDFEQYKKGTFSRRVERRVALSNAGNIENYIEMLESNGDELRDLYQDLLIGVTEFFRDPDAFDELQHEVLPRLIESAQQHQMLRIWVTPCATGEEAYSIAIIVDELIRQRQYPIDVKIFATDVNQQCIEVAGKGIYLRDRLENVSAQRLAEYFNEVESGFQIIPRIRRQVVFARQNLLNDAPFTKLDLVCCRNLLIYLRQHAKKKALSLFNFSLNQAGVLFLGPSESVTELENSFVVINEKWRIFQKKEHLRFSQVNMSIAARETSSRDVASKKSVNERELGAVYDALLSAYIPPAFLVGEDNRVLHIFGNAADLLAYGEGRPSDDLLQLLPEPVRIAALGGLRRAKLEGQAAIYPGIKVESLSGETWSCQLTVTPVENRFSTKYLITIAKTEFSPAQNEANELQLLGSQRSTLVEALERELQETRDSLHESIMNLKSANEEMQTTNEELIASNEELQSTNEELHSVNEELYTVNAEFQRKITELTELTDDMDNLLDCLQIDTVYLDSHLRVRKFTLGIANIFRLLPQDIGRDFASFNHQLKHDDIIGSIQTVLESEQPRDEEVKDNHGNWYLMRLLPYNARGQVDGVLLTLIDITAIKATEQRLCELSEIVESSNDAIFRISESGSIKTWNRGAQDLFLHEPESIIGKNVETLSAECELGNKISVALEQIGRGTPIEHVELKAMRRNGEELDVQSTISGIYRPDGQLDGASIVMRDITLEKKAEHQIREQVRRRDQFIAVLSHELRNPMAAVTNALSVVKKHELHDSGLQRAFEIIQQQSDQVAKMLDDLLHVSRITHDKFKLQLQTVDICEVARQVAQSVAHRINSKNQQLVMELPSDPVFAFADETRMIQAQTNLLINASKYTPDFGQIVLSIREDDGEVLLEVSDNGQGISEGLLERVFEVFVQSDQPLDRSLGGMGLGLPLVKMIALAHGGCVSVHSEGRDRGTTVKFSIPVGDVDFASNRPKSTSISRQCLQGTKLLLVEDNDDSREMLAEFLELEGIEVVAARNGTEAIELARKIRPQIYVLDIGLPDMNGYELAVQFRQDDAESFLVALTGYGQEDDQKLVRQAGFDLHLVKPMNPELLVEKLARHLETNAQRVIKEAHAEN